MTIDAIAFAVYVLVVSTAFIGAVCIPFAWVIGHIDL